MHYELRSVSLGASPLSFVDGRLWRDGDASWGVDLAGVGRLAEIDWHEPLRFEATGCGGERLVGDALIDALDAPPPQTRRVRLCAGGDLVVVPSAGTAV